MKQIISLIIVAVMSLTYVKADVLKGFVIDNQNNAIEGAYVLALTESDSLPVGRAVSDNRGKFAMNVSRHNVIVKVSHVGFAEYSSATKVEGKPLTIVLTPANEMLDEVVVISSAIKQDATGYTVKNLSKELVRGKKISEILPFMPGVNNESGVMKLYGMSVSAISVDGVTLRNQKELDNISAEMIEKIRVNYMAGSSQNASSVGGSISVSLKKPEERGYYGDLNAGGTMHAGNGVDSGNAGGAVYYRNKNTSVYDNFSFSHSGQKETGEHLITGTLTPTKYYAEERNKLNDNDFSNRLSIVQQLCRRTSVGLGYYVESSIANPYSSTTTDETRTEINKHNNILSQEATAIFKHLLNSKGDNMEVLLDYYNRVEKSDISYLYSSGNCRTEDKTNLNTWKLSLVYSSILNKKMMFRMGGNLSWLSSKYKPNVELGQGEYANGQTDSNADGFTPNLFVQLSGVWNRLRYSFGLNWQLNHIGYEESDAEHATNTQWSINPTLQVMVPFGKNNSHAFVLNYRHVLDNIPYAAISSAVRWTDANNYTIGNAALKAPSMHVLMGIVSLWNAKLNLTALYSNSKNNIYWQTIADGSKSNVFYTCPINVNSTDALAFMGELNLKPIKCWTMKLSGKLEWHFENMEISGVLYDKAHLRQYYSFNNSFGFKNGWGGLLNAVLEPTFGTFDRTYHTVYNIGGNVYKTFLKGRLQATLSFNVLGNRRKYDRCTESAINTFKYTTPVQSIGFSLRWHFSGKRKVKVETVEGKQNYNEIKDIR